MSEHEASDRPATLNEERQEVSLVELIEVLRSRRWTVVGFTILTPLVVLAVTYLTRPSPAYKATARVSGDSAVVDLVSSESFLHRVLEPGVGPTPGEETEADSVLRRRLTEEGGGTDAAVRQLRTLLEVEERDGAVQISATSDSRDLSLDVVQATLEELLWGPDRPEAPGGQMRYYSSQLRYWEIESRRRADALYRSLLGGSTAFSPEVRMDLDSLYRRKSGYDTLAGLLTRALAVADTPSPAASPGALGRGFPVTETATQLERRFGEPGVVPRRLHEITRQLILATWNAQTDYLRRTLDHTEMRRAAIEDSLWGFSTALLRHPDSSSARAREWRALYRRAGRARANVDTTAEQIRALEERTQQAESGPPEVVAAPSVTVAATTDPHLVLRTVAGLLLGLVLGLCAAFLGELYAAREAS